MRMLYRGLVALHPPSFRRQFGPEMELIFEDSGQSPKLLIDVLISLGRQWLLRSHLWIFGVAAVGGFIPFALGFGIISWTSGSLGFHPVMHRHLHRTAALHSANMSDTASFMMLTAVIALMFISGTMVFAITWFRYSQQRRRA